ncbi:hypothetical protein KAR91_15070 [Candidatus Pacearchaeota archaeon]|nr:hypothetical protein [Candidatus Pacearchaeota archaeon]
MIGNNGHNLVEKAPIPGAIIMPQPQLYFLKEQAMTQSQRHSFGTDEVKWFLIDPTKYEAGPTQSLNRIIGEVPSFFAAAGPLEIDFYRAITLGAAVPTLLTLPAFNRVATSAISPQLELSSLSAAPGTKTKYSELLIPSSATGVGQQVGFSVEQTLPFALDLENVIAMSVKNLDGAGTLVGIRWNWFEI